MSNKSQPNTKNMIITITQPQKNSPQYMVQVTSPAGNAFSGFILPDGWNDGRLPETLSEFRHNVSTDRYLATRGKAPGTLTPRSFGEMLFKAVFKQKVEKLYRDSLAAAQKNAANLPLRLDVRPQPLARLPWEFLFDPQEKLETGYLSFGEETPIIRCFEKTVEPGMFGLPLRILLVSANPAGSALLQLTNEYDAIDKAIKTLPPEKRQIDYLFGATIDSFTERIRNFKPHIVHFMGHGNVQQLLMQDGETFRSESLAITLKNNPSLRLVVLNACQAGGVLESNSNSEAQFGVARSLARSGVPAVVAMQFPISDAGAIIFAKEFYKVLVERGSVDRAVTWARIAMQTRLPGGSMEWATPVLYLQTEHGALFEGLFRRMRPEADTEPEIDIKTVLGDRRDFDITSIKARIQGIEQQLSIHVKNLGKLEPQAAQYGALGVPLWLQNEIDNEKDAIEELQKERFDLRTELDAAANTATSQSEESVESTLPASDKPAAGADKAEEEQKIRLEVYYEDGIRFYKKEDWEKAIDFLQRVHDIDATYRNVATVLDSARQKLAAQKEQRGSLSRLETLFNQAVQHMEAVPPRRREAIDLLQFIKSQDGAFKSVAVNQLLQQAETGYQQSLETEIKRIQQESFYQRAAEELAQQQWNQAIYLLEELARLSVPERYKDAADLLKEARRQRSLSETYAKGQTAFENRRWSEAKIHFGQVCAWEPDYRDAADKLAVAEQEETLDSRYRAGLDFINAKRWQETLESLEPLAESDPYRPEVKHARSYAQAHLYLLDKKWEEAIALLQPLASSAYKEANTHLQTAKNEARWAKAFAQGQAAFNQGRWQAAINDLQSIVDQNPDYKDGKVQQQLKVAKEKAELHHLYTIATNRKAERNWDEAIRCFEKITAIRPTYKDARSLLAKTKTDKKCFELFNEGKLAFNRGEFQITIRAFEELSGVAPDYKSEEIVSLLNDARRRLSWKERHQSGEQAINRQKWAEALAYLKEVDPGFLNVNELLTIAGRQLRLTQLYTEGQAHLQAGRWDEAINVFQHLQTELEKDPDPERDRTYADTPDLLKQAQHQKELASLYKKAEAARDNRDWRRVIDTLTHLLKVNKERDYKHAKAWLADSKTELDFETAFARGKAAFEAQQWPEAIAGFEAAIKAKPDHPEAKKLKQRAENLRIIQELMQQGQQHETAGRWEKARQSYQQILNEVDPTHSDAIEKRNQAVRMGKLTSLMAQADAAVEQEKWADAIDFLEQIAMMDDRYGNVEQKLANARKEKNIAQKYNQGVQALQNGLNNFDRDQLQRAIDLFEQITTAKPEGHKDAAGQLAKSREELQLLDNYATAELLLKGQDWRKAIEKLEQIQERRPDYRDTKNWLKEARINEEDQIHWDKADELLKPNKPEPDVLQKAKRELQLILDSDPSVYNPKAETRITEIEAQLRQYLQACYDRMLAEAEVEQWEQALKELGEICAVDSTFNNAPDELHERIIEVRDRYFQEENFKEARNVHGFGKKAAAYKQ